jgi:hypothetical protein
VRRLNANIHVGCSLVCAAASFSIPALAQTASDQPSPPATIKVGDRAPEFSLAGSDGRTYRLTELQGKQRLVLVIFRGVW